MKFDKQVVVYVPIAIAIAMLLALFVVVDGGQMRLRDATQRVSQALERQAIIADLMQKIFDAEAAQRGFLLTEDSKYLKFLDPAMAQIEPLLDRLGDSYTASGRTEALPELRRLRTLTGIRIGEIRTSLRLYGEQGVGAALSLVKTDFGKKATDNIRASVQILRDVDRHGILAATAGWQKDLSVLRFTMIVATALNIALLLISGGLFARDLRRRAEYANDLATRNLALDSLVQQRTQTLSELSSHLQTVTEYERRSLARELHDELGGLLVATKMDLVWLRRKLANNDPDIAVRWERILRSIEQGLDFKRRIIESLRPTLLDNLGLIAALRWLVEEACRPASLEYHEEYPEALPELSNDVNIALFRVVQECLTNILQHAHATRVDIRLELSGDTLVLTIEDNGVGIPYDRINRPGSHGLSGMRHRLYALGGDLVIQRRAAVGGTRIRATLRRLTTPTFQDALASL